MNREEQDASLKELVVIVDRMRWYCDMDAKQDCYLTVAEWIRAGRKIEDLEKYAYGVQRYQRWDRRKTLSRESKPPVIRHMEYQDVRFKSERDWCGERETIREIIDKAPSHEERLIDAQRKAGLSNAIRVIKPKQREILERFYFDEQPKEQIQAEMGMTNKQFTLYKSRAIEAARKRAA